MTVKELIKELEYIRDANPDIRVVTYDGMAEEGGQVKLVTLTDELPYHADNWDIELDDNEYVVVIKSN